MKKAFTLIEMAVVLLIIGILAGIVLRNIGGQSIQARDAKRVGDLRILANYLAQYLAKRGEFPTTTPGNTDSSPNWPVLSAAFSAAGINVNLPTPPAGAPYEYIPCTDAGQYLDTNIPTNHFILRTRLEQSYSQAPRVYEGSYTGPIPPSNWSCSVSGQNCSPTSTITGGESRYYCITQ